MANQLPKGPQGPRRYPGQNEAAQKQRDAMQSVKNQDLAKKMRDAYENFQKSPEADTIGMKKGGKIKKYQDGGSVRNAPNPYYGRSPTQPYDKRKYVNFPGGRSDKDIATPVIPDPVKYPEYIEEVGEERVSGPRMRKGGMVKSSASKRADGIAQRGKTRGRIV